jgi:hypothetical protein
MSCPQQARRKPSRRNQTQNTHMARQYAITASLAELTGVTPDNGAVRLNGYKAGQGKNVQPCICVTGH